MLLEAARGTDGLLADPPPYVFQTALDDYPSVLAVCQASPTDPFERAKVVSSLHAAIQDAFRAGRTNHVAALHGGSAAPRSSARALVRGPARRDGGEAGYERGWVRAAGRLTSGTRHRAHHLHECVAANLHAEEHREHASAVGAFHRHSVDVRIRIGDRGRKVGEQAAAIGHDEPYARVEDTLHVSGPLDVDDLALVDALALERRTVAHVHGQALALAELGDDRVAGNRAAAFRV